MFLFMIETKLNDRISKTILYKQFVDDNLIFTDSKNFVNTLNLFNSVHPKLSAFYEEANVF